MNKCTISWTALLYTMNLTRPSYLFESEHVVSIRLHYSVAYISHSAVCTTNKENFHENVERGWVKKNLLEINRSAEIMFHFSVKLSLFHLSATTKPENVWSEDKECFIYEIFDNSGRGWVWGTLETTSLLARYFVIKSTWEYTITWI